MPGIKTVNKYNCADCLFHKCDCAYKCGKNTCDGICIYSKNRYSCTRKICLNFVLDKLVRMC